MAKKAQNTEVKADAQPEENSFMTFGATPEKKVRKQKVAKDTPAQEPAQEPETEPVTETAPTKAKKAPKTQKVTEPEPEPVVEPEPVKKGKKPAKEGTRVFAVWWSYGPTQYDDPVIQVADSPREAFKLAFPQVDKLASNPKLHRYAAEIFDEKNLFEVE